MAVTVQCCDVMKMRGCAMCVCGQRDKEMVLWEERKRRAGVFCVLLIDA